jgi:type I restriction enzyme S subunit
MKKKIIEELEKIRNGEVPEGYKKERESRSPVGWNRKKIGSFLDVKYGKSQKEIEDVNGKYSILGTGGIIGKTDQYLYDKETVLIGRKGTIDKPVYYDRPFWTIDTLFYTEINTKLVDIKWVYYMFNTINWLKYNEATGVPSLSVRVIENIKVLCPPLEEQKKIAYILTTWDKAIEMKQELLEKKKQLKKGLMQRLLTGELRLPGFDGEWKEIKLDSLIKFVNGYAFKSSNYVENGEKIVVTISNVQSGNLDLTNSVKKISSVPNNLNRNQQLVQGDILISMTGNVGRICRVDVNNCLLNQRVGKLISNEKIQQKFLYHKINTVKFQNRMEALSSGSSQSNLSTKEIKRYKVYIPTDLEEQKAIAEVLSTADKSIELIEKQIENLKLQKKGLMQLLLTGIVRVNELDIKVN